MIRRLQLFAIGAVLLVAAFSTGLPFLFYLVYLAILVVGGSYVLTRLGLSDLEAGYAVSQQKRKRVEEPFGWGKTIGGLARPMLRGVKKLDFKFTLTMAAYDLIKLPRLIGVTA